MSHYRKPLAAHEIIPVRQRKETQRERDVVAPLCETADYPGLDREAAVEDGELLAVLYAGAYGATIDSNIQYTPSDTRCDGGH